MSTRTPGDAGGGGATCSYGPLLVCAIDYKPEVAELALALVEAHLPVEVRDLPRQFEDWEVACPVFLGRATATLRAIFLLEPPEGYLDAKDLTRSLAESIITFAWLAADPAAHMEEWVTELYQQRLKLHNLIVQEIGMRSAYKELMRERFPCGLIPFADLPATRTRAAKKVQSGSLVLKAFEADDYWVGTINVLESNPFALLYASVYGQYSMTAHSSVHMGFDLVKEERDRLLVGKISIPPEDRGPYGIALVWYLVALVVAAKTLGWPDEGEVYAVIAGA